MTDVSGLFTNCTALVSVPDGLLDKLTKVTTVSSFFNGCSSLRTVPNDFFKSQTEVTASGMIFKGCSSLESVPSGLLDPFTKTTTIGSLFSGCKSLGNLPEGLFDKVGSNVDPSAKAVDASYLFENCVKMTDFPSLSKLPNVSNVASALERLYGHDDGSCGLFPFELYEFHFGRKHVQWLYIAQKPSCRPAEKHD